MIRIIEAQTEQEAVNIRNAIDVRAATYWPEQGYTVDGTTLVGKNASTGQDNPASQRTTTWSAVQESPVGTFYISSLVGTPYENFMDELALAFTFEEKEFPSEWIEEPV